MKKSWIVLAIIAVVVFLGITRPPEPDEEPASAPAATPAPETKTEKKPVTPEAKKVAAIPVPRKQPVQPLKELDNSAAVPPNAVRFKIDDGLAVIQGDMVAGVPVDANGANSGIVLMPTVSAWKSNEIAVFVQANLSHPERVREALELFSDTAVRFVPYTDQEDVLVFEEGTGHCKSYVGRVGGKQPIWISPGCGASEVAHEIMHALGFVHEQNRTDRDQYIEIFPDNIDEEYKYNFDKLPDETMKLTGLTDFDYESLMLYPASMFAKDGKQTMRSRSEKTLNPSTGLSVKDKERLQKAYGPR